MRDFKLLLNEGRYEERIGCFISEPHSFSFVYAVPEKILCELGVTPEERKDFFSVVKNSVRPKFVKRPLPSRDGISRSFLTPEELRSGWWVDWETLQEKFRGGYILIYDKDEERMFQFLDEYKKFIEDYVEKCDIFHVDIMSSTQFCENMFDYKYVKK